MDELLYTPKPNHSSSLHMRVGMAFLAENPEAFGFISDAYPMVTDEWLIAAHGRETEAGAASFTYPASGGIEGLYENVFPGILTPDSLTDELLAKTFGDALGRREHPVARYVAAVSEAVSAEVLRDVTDAASHEEMARRLGEAVPEALSALREHLCRDGLTARDAELYAVSLAVCRMKSLGGGSYTLDLFMAGDYRVYLLDAHGMRPLRLPHTSEIFPEGPILPMEGKQIQLRHPSPFAVLLLSGSACSVHATEAQALKENPGLVWLYRMRLEAGILRILTALSNEDDFGGRAGQFFTGRACGRESASGALSIWRGETSFSTFRSDCLTRLRHLEDMIALLPDGYDPARVPPLPSRVETETAFIRRMLSQEQGLLERTTDALRALALEKLYVSPAEEIPLPEEVPELRRITREDIAETYRVYDAENDEDYEHIRRNRAAMREQMADHWVTLRPVLLRAAASLRDGEDGEVSSACAASDRAYASLQRLNARLGHLAEERRRCLHETEQRLADHRSILKSAGNDWLSGRAGTDHAAAWADTAAGALSDALRELANTYERTEGEYRSLLTAYMTERDRLFQCDAETADGAFSAEWAALLNGQLSEEHGKVFRDAILFDMDELYVKLWDDVYVISRGTGARLARVRDRAADRRMARDIAARSEFRIAALRASAYRDADWGEGVCELLDTAHRNSYFTVVRRWQETCELMARQAAAYEEYRTLYEGKK